mmetsp:Transcript_49697/g.107969  ORF Transcript_49697/g.107969 Transcript_49697/m.107969 type:complete len:85 (-) Transcript_49697:554-808(-)
MNHTCTTLYASQVDDDRRDVVFAAPFVRDIYKLRANVLRWSFRLRQLGGKFFLVDFASQSIGAKNKSIAGLPGLFAHIRGHIRS